MINLSEKMRVEKDKQHLFGRYDMERKERDLLAPFDDQGEFIDRPIKRGPSLDDKKV